jgi:subtilisin family serine protease
MAVPSVSASFQQINQNNEKFTGHDYAPDEIIVRLKPVPGMNVAQSSSAAAQVNREVNPYIIVKRDLTSNGLAGVQVVKLPSNLSVPDALEQYRKDPRVQYAEPNYRRYITSPPDDPLFQSLWGLHNTGQTGGTFDADIDTPEAWNITTGSNTVVIAVIDTGVDYRHPDLSSNIWINTNETKGNGIDDEHNGYIDDVYGWNFGSGNNDPLDHVGHGTHCAGTIGAIGNNGNGITGVNWNVKIMALKVSRPDGYIYDSDAISAILYATKNGASIISCSWGGPRYNQAMKDTIDQSGALFVFAAGNDATNNDQSPFYPASYNSSNIISVAATDENDNLASFSNYGVITVDIAAPGVAILSTLPGKGTLQETLFSDNMTSLSKWNVQTPWGRNTLTFASSPSSADDSPYVNYKNNENSALTLKTPISLVNITPIKLQYLLTIDVSDCNDGLAVEASTDNTSWDTLIGWCGSTQGNFVNVEQDISQYDNADKLYIRFRFESNEVDVSEGVQIDDVEIIGSSDNSPLEYGYGDRSGTSMATPHVAGVTGLVKAVNPSLTNLQMKAILLSSAEIIPSLNGKVATGGRLNAYTSVLQASNTTIIKIPGFTTTPTDPDGDGLYEDLNGNGRKDFNDVVIMFNQMQWIAVNEPVSAFDFNGNGRIDFNDIVVLFGEM